MFIKKINPSLVWLLPQLGWLAITVAYVYTFRKVRADILFCYNLYSYIQLNISFMIPLIFPIAYTMLNGFLIFPQETNAGNAGRVDEEVPNNQRLHSDNHKYKQ